MYGSLSGQEPTSPAASRVSLCWQICEVGGGYLKGVIVRQGFHHHKSCSSLPGATRIFGAFLASFPSGGKHPSCPGLMGAASGALHKASFKALIPGAKGLFDHSRERHGSPVVHLRPALSPGSGAWLACRSLWLCRWTAAPSATLLSAKAVRRLLCTGLARNVASPCQTEE